MRLKLLRINKLHRCCGDFFDVDYLFILFYILLLLSYPFIANKYSYWGFVVCYKLISFLFGVSFLLVAYLLKKLIRDEFLSTVFNFILVIFFIPQVVFYQSTSLSIKPLIAHSLFLVVFTFASNFKFKITSFKIPLTIKSNFIFFVILSFSLLTPFLYYYSSYIDFRNLLFVDVYDTRYLFRNISLESLSYIINPLTRILLPVVLVVSLIKNNYFLIVITILGVIFLYLCGAFKSYFFGLIAVLFFFRGNYNQKYKRFLVVINAFLFVGLFVTFFFNNITILDLFVRRIFVIPPFLDYNYFNLYENNYTFWSHNPIGNLFIQSTLDKPIPIEVGELLFNKEGVNANVGFVTEGFLSLGFIGVFFHSIIVSFIFVFIKSLRIYHSFFGIIFIFIFVALNSFLTVMFVTHGLLFFIIISYFFLRDSSDIW